MVVRVHGLPLRLRLRRDATGRGEATGGVHVIKICGLFIFFLVLKIKNVILVAPTMLHEDFMNIKQAKSSQRKTGDRLKLSTKNIFQLNVKQGQESIILKLTKVILN